MELDQVDGTACYRDAEGERFHFSAELFLRNKNRFSELRRLTLGQLKSLLRAWIYFFFKKISWSTGNVLLI